MNTPKKANLVTTFSVEKFGGDCVKLADLNGDGRPELIIAQGAGQLKAEIECLHPLQDDADRFNYCLTAVDLRGNVLWQHGEPYTGTEPFLSHGAEEMVIADDFDDDGRIEVATVQYQTIHLLEGATGRERYSTRLPSDNLTKLYSARLQPPGKQILCTPHNRGYPPWEYANPAIAFNADLSEYREAFAVRGAGHTVVSLDVDGNGRDEVLTGYSLLDSRLQPIWSIDLGKDFDYAKHHADHIGVSDLPEGGRIIRYCAETEGDEDFFITDMNGKKLWASSAGHAQKSAAGVLAPGDDFRIVMCEKSRYSVAGLRGFDLDGNALWHWKEQGGYATIPVRWMGTERPGTWLYFKPHSIWPEHQISEFNPEYSRELWPKFLDGDGSMHEVLPWDDNYAIPRQTCRTRRLYDCGVCYDAVAADIDGDGLDEIIVFNRFRVWIFHST